MPALEGGAHYSSNPPSTIFFLHLKRTTPAHNLKRTTPKQTKTTPTPPGPEKQKQNQLYHFVLLSHFHIEGHSDTGRDHISYCLAAVY